MCEVGDNEMKEKPNQTKPNEDDRKILCINILGIFVGAGGAAITGDDELQIPMK